MLRTTTSSQCTKPTQRASTWDYCYGPTQQNYVKSNQCVACGTAISALLRPTAEVGFLPQLAYAFTKLYGAGERACFEVLATFLLNWGCHWFAAFPHPPVGLLAAMDSVLAQHDPELREWLATVPGGAGRVAWGLVGTCMAPVVGQQEWLVVGWEVGSRMIPCEAAQRVVLNADPRYLCGEPSLACLSIKTSMFGVAQ